MDDLIERKRVVEVIQTTPLHITGIRLGKTSIGEQYAEGCRYALEEAVRDIEPLPDIERVRHGYWIERGQTEAGARILECSECHRVRRGSSRSNYCRDCGAKMDILFKI